MQIKRFLIIMLFGTFYFNSFNSTFYCYRFLYLRDVKTDIPFQLTHITDNNYNMYKTNTKVKELSWQAFAIASFYKQ